MNCFHCGNRLGKGDMCLTCGQDVRLYKKIVAVSWQYYDEGLRKAQVRDLSGAVESLKNSLLLYKKNTEARNLLGLVYYEMGDIAEALVEWVISDNMDPSDDHAARLLSLVQSDQVELERGSLMIRKYNQALKYARSGSEDLAILQLNKVLGTNPRMVKANLLMALLQLHAGQPDRAEKYVRAVLKIDRFNPQALRYEEELHSREVRKAAVHERSIVSKESEVRRGLNGDDVIIPTYKESKVGLQTVLEVLAGIALGAALVGYLIMPSRISSIRSDFNKTLSSYNERLSAKEAIIASGEDEIARLNERIAKLEENVQSADANTAGVVEEYGKLLKASQALSENEYLQAASLFLTIDPSLVPDTTFREVYDAMHTEFTENGYTVLRDDGIDLYNRRRYEAAEEYFKTCLGLSPESLEAKYWLGMAYLNQNEKDTAYSYFEDIIAADSSSPFAGWAAEHMETAP